MLPSATGKMADAALLSWQELMSSAPASVQFLVTCRSLQKQWLSGLSVGAARVSGSRTKRDTWMPSRSLLSAKLADTDLDTSAFQFTQKPD